MAARQGLYGVLVLSYGPQIRGGESAAVVRIAAQTGAVRGRRGRPPAVLPRQRRAPLRGPHPPARWQPAHPRGERRRRAARLARRSRGRDLPLPVREDRERRSRCRASRSNMLGLGLLCRALGWSDTLAHESLRARFGHRPEALARNLAAFDRAYAATAAPPALPRLPVVKGTAPPRVVETGQRGGGARRDRRGAALLRRLPDHAVVRDHGDAARGDAARPGAGGAGRGRDRRARHGAGRQLRRRAPR